MIQKARKIESNLNETKVVDSAKRDKQEDFFKETREILLQREKYIEDCENELVARLTQLTQREAEIEQREEHLDYMDRKLK